MSKTDDVDLSKWSLREHVVWWHEDGDQFWHATPGDAAIPLECSRDGACWLHVLEMHNAALGRHAGEIAARMRREGLSVPEVFRFQNECREYQLE